MIRAEPGSKTGKYVWREGRLVKVSDKVPAKPDVYVPQGGYVDEHLGRSFEDSAGNSHWRPVEVTSPEQKARLLKKHKVVEDGGWKKPRAFRPVTVDLGSS